MFPVTETMSASAESADEEEWYHGKTAFSSLETEDEKAFSITGNYVPCYIKTSKSFTAAAGFLPPQSGPEGSLPDLRWMCPES